jgi:hypothetical protein
VTFEHFFDTTFNDRTLDLSKGDLKVAIKNFAKQAFLEGKIDGLIKAEQIALSPVFEGMPQTRAVAIRNLGFKE